MIIRYAKKVPEDYYEWVDNKAIPAWKSEELNITLEDVDFQSNTNRPVRIKLKNGNEYDISFEEMALLRDDYTKRNNKVEE